MLPRGDRCEKRNSLYTKTEQPGRFSYTSPRECLAPSPASCRGAHGVPPAPSPVPRSPVPAPALAQVPGLSSALHVLAGWGSKHDIRVVETNYEEYAMVFTRISKSTGSSTMVLLYSTSALDPHAAPPPPAMGCPQWEERGSVISQAGVTMGWVPLLGNLSLAGLPALRGSVTPLGGPGAAPHAALGCRPDQGAQS